MTIVPRIRFATMAAASLALAGSLAPAQAAQAPTSRAGAATVQGQSQSAEPRRRTCVRSELPNPRLTRYLCRTQDGWNRAGPIPTAD